MARISKPTSSDASISDLKVLIVDDEPFIRNLIKRVINTIGILLVAEASEPETARAGLESFQPDIVILDINMPGESGLHFLRSIRAGATSAKRDLPVIILTSLEGNNVLPIALELDANAFISKGEGFKKLEARLRRVLNDPLELRNPESYVAVDIPNLENISNWAQSDTIKNLDGGGNRVPANAFKIGNILTADLLTHGGQLLLTKGTVINESMRRRIADIEETFGLKSGS